MLLAAGVGDGGDGGQRGRGKRGVVDVDVEGSDRVGDGEIARGIGHLIGDDLDDIRAVVSGVECAARSRQRIGTGDCRGIAL